MFDGAFYSAKNPILDENVARQLYGNKENIGITRLERFAARILLAGNFLI